MLALTSSCGAQKNLCDNKLVVLNGNELIPVMSQWDACVARNASKIAFNNVNDTRLSEIAVELCASFESRYQTALLNGPPKLTLEQAKMGLDAYRANELKLAISEARRARNLGCEAK